MAKIPLHPKNPERVCWGCDKYCPADHLDCGNGTVRTQHPIEIFGEDWLEPQGGCPTLPEGRGESQTPCPRENAS